MGITGLIPFLEKASKKCNISEFSGCTVAVDTYCWLHKGAFSCADKLARGEFTDAHIKYCMKYVNMLLSHSIKPILVFDGRHLPAKALTEKKRRESRTTAKIRAAEFLRLGQMEEARSYLRRSVDITHEMALQLIKQCRQRNVDCIVAPYEADAQMAYLNKINIAQIIITEDSDLILFGCNKILFKMDLNGNGVLVESSKLPLVMKCPLEHYSFIKFRQMCIMSGCDYLSSLPGIGLAKARQFINATRDPDISNALRKLPSYFNKSQMVVSDEYREGFLKAEATFKHQLVYDPLQRKLLPLNNLEDEGTDPQMCSNAGAALEPDIAFQLALGNLDPFSLRVMDEWHPDHHMAKPGGGKTNGWNQNPIAPHKSIWSKEFLDHVSKPKPKNTKINNMTTFIIPTTRSLASKVVSAKCEENKIDDITIENLSSMYSVKEPVKKHIVVPETQDFDSIETLNVVSKNPFSLHTSKRLSSSPEKIASVRGDSSSSKKRGLSPDKKNSSSPETSPIIERKSKNYKRMLESGSFSKFTKLNKFQRTIIDEKNLVESKFFNTFVSTLDRFDLQNVVKDESGLNVSGIAALNVDDSDLSKRESLSNQTDEIPSPDSCGDGIVPLKDNNNKRNDLDFKNNLFKISLVQNTDTEDSYNENTYPFENLVTPVASQGFSQNMEEFICESQEAVPVLSVIRSQPLPKACNNYTKSKSCRRPGLQRKSSAPVLSAQQSLLTSFGFKKSQLKH